MLNLNPPSIQSATDMYVIQCPMSATVVLGVHNRALHHLLGVAQEFTCVTLIIMEKTWPLVGTIFVHFLQAAMSVIWNLEVVLLWRVTELTLGTHQHEGYSTHFVCVFRVCCLLIHQVWRTNLLFAYFTWF